MNDQKNLILAIALSVVIMVTFQYFFEPPPPPPQETQQTQGEQATPGQGPGQAPGQAQTGRQQIPPAPATPTPGTGAAPAIPPGGAPANTAAPAGGTRTVIEGPRVAIDTPRLEGSLALRGAAIDDVTLRDYHVTTNPDSDRIRIFAPPGNVRAYYATEGWIPADPNVPVPGQDTVWTTADKVLTHEKPVTLTWNNGAGLTFERTIAVDENYMFTITQSVRNTGDKAVTLTPYSLINRTGTPPTTGFYILHEGPLGVFDGTLVEEDYDDVAEEKTITRTSTGGWIGITDKYWLAALVPESNARINARFLHWRTSNQDKYQADFAGEAQTAPPGGAIENRTYLFSGAKEVRLLDGYADKLGIANFDLAIDFGWFYFLTKPFFYLLDILSGFLGNFGLAILGVTVLVKLVFFPLANKSYKSMAQMRKLQPKMKELKEKFGDDRQRMNQEMMGLYKKEKVNPASSCLPILIQIPVFFALYKVLFVSIEMRHAPFYGWIHDLSAPDPTSFLNLFGLLPYSIPVWVPEFISIGAWPIIMGVLMFVQMKLNPPPPDPVQAKIFMFMPVIFTFIMAPFPAGLVIYWAWNNLLSVGQQWYIMKNMEKVDARKAAAKKGA